MSIRFSSTATQCHLFRALIVLALFGLVLAVNNVILPVALSVILCLVMQPVADWLECGRLGRLGWRMPRTVAIAVTFALFILLGGGLLLGMMLPVAGQAYDLTENLPSIVAKVQYFWQQALTRFNAADIPEDVRGVIQKIFAGLANLSLDLSGRVFSATIDFATRVVELFIVPLLTYYLLKDGRNLVRGIVGLFADDLQPRVQALSDELGEVLSGYLLGQATVCLLIGLVVAAGLTWLGIPYALVLGVLAALTEAIPVIGAIIGAVPALLIALLVSPATALKVLIFYVIVFKIDSNIVVPQIVGKRIRLHPMVIIICLLIGAQLNGILGMVAAVPVTAVAVVVIKHLWQWRQGRGLPREAKGE
ncbi:MAG: AI-2E family transporter [Negativicutes bacterium]|nr:AI-2E family transporter [Negativicutes bacterium]